MFMQIWAEFRILNTFGNMQICIEYELFFYFDGQYGISTVDVLSQLGISPVECVSQPGTSTVDVFPQLACV